jgi:hypothetical protein
MKMEAPFPSHEGEYGVCNDHEKKEGPEGDQREITACQRAVLQQDIVVRR